MSEVKRPQYYAFGRFSDIPDETLAGIAEVLEQNPAITLRELAHTTGDILSEREFADVIKYLKHERGS
jgi:hypothetical protein